MIITRPPRVFDQRARVSKGYKHLEVFIGAAFSRDDLPPGVSSNGEDGLFFYAVTQRLNEFNICTVMESH
jgi:hypothetical protein